MGFQVSKTDIESVVNCVPDAVERVLKVVQVKLEQFLSGVRGKRRGGGRKEGSRRGQRRKQQEAF